MCVPKVSSKRTIPVGKKMSEKKTNKNKKTMKEMSLSKTLLRKVIIEKFVSKMILFDP